MFTSRLLLFCVNLTWLALCAFSSYELMAFFNSRKFLAIIICCILSFLHPILLELLLKIYFNVSIHPDSSLSYFSFIPSFFSFLSSLPSFLNILCNLLSSISHFINRCFYCVQSVYSLQWSLFSSAFNLYKKFIFKISNGFLDAFIHTSFKFFDFFIHNFELLFNLDTSPFLFFQRYIK